MKAAIIGCGNIAQVHAACVSEMKEHQLVAFADIDIEKARAMSRKYGGDAFSSMEKLLEKTNIDILHICTPHYLHAPMAEYALKFGVNVFMEKPPVINEEQYDMLKEVRTNKQLGVCFQNRYNQSFNRAREMLESGKAGKILGARGIVTWNRQEKYYTESQWRGRLALEGGGALINQSIHTMDLLNELLGGAPDTVDAAIMNHHLKGIIEVEDTMSAHILYGTIPVCFYVTTAYSSDPNPIIELDCERMKIRIEGPNVTYFYLDGKIEALNPESEIAPGKNYWGTGHRLCIAKFYECVFGKKKFSLDLDGINSTVCLMLGAYKSAREGKTIILNAG